MIAVIRMFVRIHKSLMAAIRICVPIRNSMMLPSDEVGIHELNHVADLIIYKLVNFAVAYLAAISELGCLLAADAEHEEEFVVGNKADVAKGALVAGHFFFHAQHTVAVQTSFLFRWRFRLLAVS